MSFWDTLSKLPKTVPGNSVESYWFDMLGRIQTYWSCFVFCGRGSLLPITVGASTTIKHCMCIWSMFTENDQKGPRLGNGSYSAHFCTTKASFNSVWEPNESSGLRIGDHLVALLWRTSAIPGAIWHWHSRHKTMNYQGLYAMSYISGIYTSTRVVCTVARSQEWFSVFFLLYRCVLGFAVLNVVNAVFVAWASSHLQELCMHLLVKLFQSHSIAKIDLQATFSQNVSVGLVGNPS